MKKYSNPLNKPLQDSDTLFKFYFNEFKSCYLNAIKNSIVTCTSNEVHM